MTDISVQNITKSFELGDEVLSGVSFNVTAGEHIGILGKNGAGKTTLFRIITGELFPDDGVVVTATGKKLGVLSQIPDYPEHFTGEDVLITAHNRVFKIEDEMKALEAKMAAGDRSPATLGKYDALSAEFLSLDGYELDRIRDTVANGLGIPKEQRERPFSTLSGGEKTRMNLARLLIEDTDILLLDEPTNHLDMQSAEWLEEYVIKFKGTCLIISHDRYFLDKTVDRIVELENGKAEFYSGNYTFYLGEKQRRYEERLKQYEKEQAKIAQLQKAADDLHLWAFMGNDKLHKRAFSIEKRIQKLNTTERPYTERKMTARLNEKEFFGDEVMTAKGVSKSFGEKKLFSDLDLLIRPEESVALIGANGSGKSTLIKLVMGKEVPDTGYLRLGPAVKAAYLPQIVEFPDPDMTALDVMMQMARLSMQDARDELAAFKFRGEDVYIKVSKLSGGERSRLMLCRLMADNINFLILDEPTNHLDITSREWIEEALEDFGGTLLFVSHDRYFINKFATRIWQLEGGNFTDYIGSFEAYRARMAMLEAQKPQVQKKEKKLEKKEKKKFSGSPEKQAQKLEREIAQLEGKLQELEKMGEEFSTDYEKLMEIETEKETLNTQLEEKYAMWEEVLSL